MLLQDKVRVQKELSESFIQGEAYENDESHFMGCIGE